MAWPKGVKRKQDTKQNPYKEVKTVNEVVEEVKKAIMPLGLCSSIEEWNSKSMILDKQKVVLQFGSKYLFAIDQAGHAHILAEFNLNHS